MFHTPAHKQSATTVIARTLATSPVRVVRGNDLIFPYGNENGDFSEPLWLASVGGGPSSHGRTPAEAVARFRVETLRRAR